MGNSLLETVAGFFVLVSIVLLSIWMPSLIVTILNNGVHPPITTISNNTLSINLDGYWRTTCMAVPPSIYVKNGSSWRKANREIWRESPVYYVDGRINTPDCDVVYCKRIWPFSVELVEYVKVGERAPPADRQYYWGGKLNLVPDFKSYPLKGEVKVEMKYFADKNCTDARNFSATFNR